MDDDIWFIIFKSVPSHLCPITEHIFKFLTIKHAYLDVLKATCAILAYQGNDELFCTAL